jgi:hypothetical protein
MLALGVVIFSTRVRADDDSRAVEGVASTV